MEQEQEELLHLMGAFLRQEAPETMPVNWGKLVQLAQIHNVLGILGYMAMQYPICPEEGLQKQLRSACKQTIMQFVQRSALAQSLLQQLSEQGIDHIVMKGYVVRNYYPVPDLRTYGDIDLVIRPEDRERSDRWLLEQGFTPEVDWDPVRSYRRGMEFYELHTEMMEVDVSEKADYRAYFRQVWDHVLPTEGHTFELQPEFHLIYLLTHIAKHIHGAGAGARMYLDIGAFFLHFGKTLDWQLVERELRKLALYDFACVVFTAVEQWFGVPAPMVWDRPEAELMEAFTEFTMEAGVFGKFNRESGVNTLKTEEKGSRAAVLLRRAFPPASQIESRYTYLQKRPWLLPAAWVDRLIRNKEHLGECAHEAQVILTADQREVERLQSLLRGIGL